MRGCSPQRAKQREHVVKQPLLPFLLQFFYPTGSRYLSGPLGCFGLSLFFSNEEIFEGIVFCFGTGIISSPAERSKFIFFGCSLCALTTPTGGSFATGCVGVGGVAGFSVVAMDTRFALISFTSTSAISFLTPRFFCKSDVSCSSDIVLFTKLIAVSNIAPPFIKAGFSPKISSPSSSSVFSRLYFCNILEIISDVSPEKYTLVLFGLVSSILIFRIN